MTLSDIMSGGEEAAGRGRVQSNSHIHLPPNFSAFSTVAQAVTLAREAGLNLLGASNYYDFTVYREFEAEAERSGIFAAFGLEIIALLESLVQDGTRINDPANPGKMYLCGKGITRFNPMSAEAARLLDVIRDSDARRIASMTDLLTSLFEAAGGPVALDAEGVKLRAASWYGCPVETVWLQERHLARAFQEALFEVVPAGNRLAVLRSASNSAPQCSPDDAAGVQAEIRAKLMKSGRPAFLPDTFVSFDHAYQLILALGGIPCYPVLADGASPVCEYEASPELLIQNLRERNIHMAEFIPVRNSLQVLERYVPALREAGLVVTAGTEHNTPDLISLAPRALGGAELRDDIARIFSEGACVVAAHQVRAARLEPGFVTETGELNAAYGSQDERISAFARAGADEVWSVGAAQRSRTHGPHTDEAG